MRLNDFNMKFDILFVIPCVLVLLPSKCEGKNLHQYFNLHFCLSFLRLRLMFVTFQHFIMLRAPDSSSCITTASKSKNWFDHSSPYILGKFIRGVTEKDMNLCHTGIRTASGRQCNAYNTKISVGM